jgi:tetratricopeptide (TPR) repeat protein
MEMKSLAVSASIIILLNLIALGAFAQNSVDPTIIKDEAVQRAVDFLAKNNYFQAKSVLEEIVKKNDKNDEAHYVLAMVLSSMDGFGDAKDAAKKAIDLKSTVAEYHYALASIYIVESRTASFFRLPAIASSMKKELETAHRLDPNHARTMVALAMYYVNVPGIIGGDKKKAIALAERLITLDEKQGRILLCQILISTKDYPKATEEANNLIILDEKQGRIFLSEIYSKLKDNEKALAEVNKIIQIDEYNGRLLLIDFYEEQGDLGKVELEYRSIERSHGNNPDYSGFYNEFGYFLLGQNRVDEAIEKLTRQVALAPESANAHDSLGEALLIKGMAKESLAEYTKALELNPYLKSAKDKVNEIRKLLDNKKTGSLPGKSGEYSMTDLSTVK